MTTNAKNVIGAVEVCEDIAKRHLQIPRQDAGYIVKNFASDPIVYPAVADRVGLLPHPNATIEFYMRLAEAKTMVDALRTKTDRPSATYVSAPMEYVKA